MYISNKIIQLFHNIYLLIKIQFKIKKILQKKGITNCQMFNFKNWHHGYAYIIANLYDKKVFIKIDTKLLLLQNDIKISNFFKETNLEEHLVPIYDYIVLNNLQIIIFEYLNGEELSKDILLNETSYASQIINILEMIYNIGIVHRDIKLDNFFIVNNKIKIIDFTFAVSINNPKTLKDLDVNKKINCAILEGLGNYTNPSPFVWNDFYTFKKILIELNNHQIFDKEINYLKNISTKNYSIIPKNIFYLFSRSLKINIKIFFKIQHSYRKLVNNEK